MVSSTAAGITGTVSTYKTGDSELNRNRDLFEYLLVANPVGPAGSRVIEVKESFYNTYRQVPGNKANPHITLAKYLAKEAMEATIERWVQRICNQQKSFKVILNNFSGYPPHTLYIRVQNPQPFHSLVNQLKVIESYVSGNSGYPVKFASNPHLPIARRLPDEIYTKALFDYAGRDFHESFIVNELVLLKRKTRTEAGQVINVFRLLPEIDDTTYSTQLNMF